MKYSFIQTLKTTELDTSEIETGHPFSNPVFFEVLENSKCVGESTGWYPLYFVVYDKKTIHGLIPLFVKTHSYGEYIFDFAWADFYAKTGTDYYPKLVATTPFTPVVGEKLLTSEKLSKIQLIEYFFECQDQISDFSSLHFHFLTEHENQLLDREDNLLQKTIQYHFRRGNKESFEDYLSALKKNRRKQIRKERRTVQTYPLKIETQALSDLDTFELNRIYQLYQSTIQKKYSHPYLSDSFFHVLASTDLNFHVELAKSNDQIVAMALFGEGETTLYGRYWGIDPAWEQDYKYLHFELCYYRGMDRIFEKKLDIFEAGAQGEQKLLRGFSPVEILSRHKIKSNFHQKVVADHLKRSNHLIQPKMRELKQFLPYSN